MAEIQKFRSAFRGFHRDDVVNYIAYMNNKHSAQIEQLTAQLQEAQNRTCDPALQSRLEAAEARCAQLEQQLAQKTCDAPVAAPASEELEAYRRAERAERMARERAQQIYEQANAVLADAAAQADAAAAQIGSVADQVTAQLQTYQQAVADTKATFQEAVATLYSIRPEE